MFNIMVVEDDRNTRKLMCDILSDEGYMAIPAGDGIEALEIMEHQHVDLAVVDIMMPNMDGYTFTRELRDGNCNLPVLMVTAKVSHKDKKRGFVAGADDYMVKPVDEEEMLWRIAALLRRSNISSDRKLILGSTVLDYNSFTVRTGGKSMILAPKEFLLLYKLLSSPRKMFTKREIMDEIWDMDSDTDEHTVEVHINRLREKFRDNPDFQIRTIRGFGYMGLPAEDENETV